MVALVLQACQMCCDYFVFSGALPISSGAFGDDTSSTVQSVTCYGNETEVLSCSYSTDDPGTCSEHSAAVICQGQRKPLYIRVRARLALQCDVCIYITQIWPQTIHHVMMVRFVLLVGVPPTRGGWKCV